MVIEGVPGTVMDRFQGIRDAGEALAASRSRAVGDRFISAFGDPAGYFPWMADLPAARRFIAERTGRPWIWTAARARVAVSASQAAFKLGLRSVPASPPPYRGAESRGL